MMMMITDVAMILINIIPFNYYIKYINHKTMHIISFFCMIWMLHIGYVVYGFYVVS